MFKRILVANRGEIALRVIRCLREMNIQSVLACSEEDLDSIPAMMAQKTVCIGPAKVMDSYLNQDAVLEAALKTGCEAVHPGYGFLSENADFAAKCEEYGIKFIGPPSSVIRLMGDKQSAKKLMRENGVPVVPGSDGLVKNVEEALEIAEKIGYPVLIKATAGGGGKGMRRVEDASQMERAFISAGAEAEAAFGNGDVYLEKCIVDPRHIEVQIIADKFGNVVQLGERDCSLQKRNQKLLEEAPAWNLKEPLRKKIQAAAVAAAKAAGYESAGTVEFVLDADGNFYFIEMNTRIQVEHPVTEAVTGVDLVREQILTAVGRPLSVKQEEISVRGHAIECRINALEPGKIETLHFPDGYGVRVESHLYEGYTVSSSYDSMIAKMIVYGKDRLEAIHRLRRVLEEVIIDGIHTNVHLMYLLTCHREFIRGGFNTSCFERIEPELREELTKVGEQE